MYQATPPFLMDPGYNQRGGTLLYSSTVQTGFRANGGQAGFLTGATADGTRALFDDVPIPNSRLGAATPVDVCHVQVGIRRLAAAPATDVRVFWTGMTTAPTAPDTEIVTPPTLLGIVSLPVNGASSVTQLVDFGVSGGATLFNAPLNSTLLPGFGTFSIGVSLSSTDSSQGWRITSGADANANVFWLYDPNHTAQPNDEGAYLFSNTNPPNPPATFYIVVEENPVPTPGAAALFGLSGGILARRRRR